MILFLSLLSTWRQLQHTMLIHHLFLRNTEKSLCRYPHYIVVKNASIDKLWFEFFFFGAWYPTEILNGGVQIIQNQFLSYAPEVNWQDIVSGAEVTIKENGPQSEYILLLQTAPQTVRLQSCSQPITWGYKQSTSCLAVPCHQSCEGPCWGPGNDSCQICEWAPVKLGMNHIYTDVHNPLRHTHKHVHIHIQIHIHIHTHTQTHIHTTHIHNTPTHMHTCTHSCDSPSWLSVSQWLRRCVRLSVMAAASAPAPVPAVTWSVPEDAQAPWTQTALWVSRAKLSTLSHAHSKKSWLLNAADPACTHRIGMYLSMYYIFRRIVLQ